MSNSPSSNPISAAFLTSLTEGVIELAHDWRSRRLPPISLEGKLQGFLKLAALPPCEFAAESRYFVDGKGKATFVFDTEGYPTIDYENTKVYVAGNFNGWDEAIGQEKWELAFDDICEKRVLSLTTGVEDLSCEGEPLFKFVTENDHWLPVDVEAPNVVNDGEGNWNYSFSEKITGRHRFKFILKEPIDLSDNNHLIYHREKGERKIYLHPGPFFFALDSDKELGAIVSQDETTFRIFAPRAKWVKVGYFAKGEKAEDASWVLLEKGTDFVWETTIHDNLSGYRYWFKLDGPNSEFSLFDPEFHILDPYAKATLTRQGPGIVIDDRDYDPVSAFNPPQWQDLVILEAHTRDLVAALPENRDRERPLGFADLERYVRSNKFYPSLLGVNAVELQPIQENDAQSQEEYHWGYMTSNYCSPASSYASDPQEATQIEEFRSLVSSFHDRGLAVILDVVYNHVGEPAHLMFVDKTYYFHLNVEGKLTNWSGCGNDYRSDAPMAKRLIIESLKRLVQFYGVDGFRFDLADLVGKAVLQDIERELKAIKPDIILIAEPWSFRGHIGMELRDTGYAYWNDGYREFVKKYVKGQGNAKGLSYFLKGSPEYYASWPAQTVNYVESHDDRTWIDDITTNAEFNGSYPSIDDLRRTHLSVAIMMMSIGIPMLHAGQDFLFSKHGVKNTYQRGDLNALNYHRIFQYPGTHAYFRDWISFRRSELGQLIRHYTRASEGFFELLSVEGRNGAALIYNADNSQGSPQLLFAINPDHEPLPLSLGGYEGAWTQLADHERFMESHRDFIRNDLETELRLPSLSCGLWVRECYS